ncbi:hypothetical protein VNO78_12876 [Psophocarpus tetragonolobus]|uniref:Uncharacterized protein n=1 Tax=Psophocarpus tetragonolobus TaxID=3891 RepID=A0AAN9SPI5_PSOTE
MLYRYDYLEGTRHVLGSGRVGLGNEENRVAWDFGNPKSFTHLGNLLPPLAHAPRVTLTPPGFHSLFIDHHHQSFLLLSFQCP